MTHDRLESITPEEAKGLYIDSIKSDRAKATVRSHDYRLRPFIEWCEEEGLTNLNELTGRDVHRFRMWRRDTGDVNPVTMKSQMDTLRVAARFWQSINAVREGLAEKVVSPELDDGQNIRDETLDSEAAKTIIEYLETYRYASRLHVLLLLIWRCLLRTGGVLALDTGDFDADEQLLMIKHRPDTGTPLKNKADGERVIALRESTAQVIEDYLESPERESVVDDHGRQPLLTTSMGRPHPNTIRSWVYGVTRPCTVTNQCPHGRDIEDCEAAGERMQASKCPSVVSPHAVRRGGITHWLLSDVPETVVEDRSDSQVLQEHYDRRSEREKAEQRRKYLSHVN